MTSYKELLDIGEDFESFVGRGLPAEISAIRTLQARLAEPEVISAVSQQRLGAVGRRYHLLVAGEMWCPDCQINITVMDYLQRSQPNIDLAIITRGRAENQLKQRLTLERIPIPLVVVLDEQFQPVGRFVEQPQQVALGGDAVKPDYRAGKYLESTVQELLDIFEACQAQV